MDGEQWSSGEATEMNFLLDSSFLIDLQNELASRVAGHATRWMRRNQKAKLWASAVSVAEVLEGAADVGETKAFLEHFHWQGIHYAHAVKVALIQSRSSVRMGENDAWQVAVAMEMKGRIVGHDRKAFSRFGKNYVDYRTEA